MKLIKIGIKLAVVALVVNATWHLFVAYSAHYKFRDSVQYATQNRGPQTDEQLHDAIMDLAAKAEVPIAPEEVVVAHQGMSTSVAASYTRPIELLPNGTYAWPFSFRIDTYTVDAPAIKELIKK